MAKRILSIQTSTLGHATHASLLRKYLASAEGDLELELESLWLEEGRDTSMRILGRLIGPRLPGRWARENNIDLRRCRSEFLLGRIGRRVADRALSRDQFDALHFHTQVAAYGSAARMRRVPTVLTGDMTAAQIAREEVKPDFRWTHAPSLEMDRRVFQAARKIAMWSEWAARSVVQDYGIGAAKVQVVYPGVDLEALDALDALVPSAQGERGPSGDGPVKLLFVGGDFERKGGPELLQVFQSELASRAELHLVTNAPIHCDHPAVRVHSGVEAYSERWLELYRECDVFVLPTRREAFGLALTEAMAMGLPVVSTRLNAIPEIVSHGQTGFLIELGDKHELAARLRDLIESVALRHTMGGRGRQVAQQKFDARRNFARLGQIFAGL